jgi:hypothetical protein
VKVVKRVVVRKPVVQPPPRPVPRPSEPRPHWPRHRWADLPRHHRDHPPCDDRHWRWKHEDHDEDRRERDD